VAGIMCNKLEGGMGMGWGAVREEVDGDVRQ